MHHQGREAQQPDRLGDPRQGRDRSCAALSTPTPTTSSTNGATTSDGLEVYRDIDADFNGKPDQCRWFNTAGTRWGLDTNEDGKIDRWKEISAEEASDELVRALGRERPTRFARLLLPPMN